MRCAVYKSLRKPDYYLYVERADDFSRVPSALLQLLGRLELVMELDLAVRHRLARANREEVLAKLVREGFYLQMPPRSASSFS